jgi:hypothetical protein
MINSPGVNEFIDLKDAPNSYVGQATKSVTVNAGETAVEFSTAGGGDVDSVNGQTGVVVLDTGDITSVTDSRYVTDAQLTVIGNTSGTNTGDNAVNSLYSGLAASKQDTLVSGTNIKTINGITILGSGDLSVGGGVSDGDKGDITVSSSGTVWTIDNGAVTAEKTSITGTPDGSKYLRDDFSWQPVAGGSGLTSPQVLARASLCV